MLIDYPIELLYTQHELFQAERLGDMYDRYQTWVMSTISALVISFITLFMLIGIVPKDWTSYQVLSMRLLVVPEFFVLVWLLAKSNYRGYGRMNMDKATWASGLSIIVWSAVFSTAFL